ASGSLPAAIINYPISLSIVQYSARLLVCLQNRTAAAAAVIGGGSASNSNATNVSFPLISAVVDVILYGTNNSAAQISRLIQPILITLRTFSDKAPQTAFDSRGNALITCRYFNTITQQWSTDGCSLHSYANGTAVCECIHLSEFAIVLENRVS